MRHAHLVGSIPAENAEEAMTAALSRLSPYLVSLADGETGGRSWIKASMQGLAANPALEVVSAGDYTSYGRTRRYRIQDGATLTPESLATHFPYAPSFQASFPIFQRLRSEYGRPDLLFQVGIPCHLDYAVDAFGDPEGLQPEYYDAALDATLLQLREVAGTGGSDVIFQIESPHALCAVADADPDEQAAAAAETARRVVDLPLRSPVGSRFGMHLCLGDMNHKASATMKDCRPAVLAANALFSVWPADRPLHYVHMPFAAADEPPSFSAEFYEPLQDLELPSSARLIAGLIHESLSNEEQLELLRLVEGIVGHEVDVAAACGLGRRPDPSEAWDAMDKAALLVTSAPLPGA